MNRQYQIPARLAQHITWAGANDLKPFPDNPRVHSIDQLNALAKSLRKFGFARPIGVDEDNTILFGHGCYEASKRMGLAQVPTLVLRGLSVAEKRALVIADNRLAERSSWDNNLLKIQFDELIKLDFDVEQTGFSVGAIDLIVGVGSGDPASEADEEAEDLTVAGPPISVEGDLWKLGNHYLICADARQAGPYRALLGNDLAQMVVTDPPYNVRIQGHARGRARKKQREFAMASGEMSSAVFAGFLEDMMHRAIEFSEKASIHYIFMDWRHLPELLRASMPLYHEWKNLLVWRKSNAGQGSFYRSQHELIAVFKAGTGPHINNFGLGQEGRHRTNVLDYPGGATLNPERQQELDMHPTVKPVALIADLMLDCSRPNGIVLDLFGGSGTAILAAEQTGRRARVIEIDPLYIDLTIRRWQQKTGCGAVHAVTGKTFDQSSGAANA